jgi:hypothetical protein
MKRSEKKELDRVLRTLIWAPLLLGGVAAALVAAQGPLGRKLRKLLAKAERESESETDADASPQAMTPRRKGARSLALLRQAIIGNDKHAVVAVFGPPPTTGGYTAPPDPGLKLPDYFRADTWYYLLDKVNRRALAIQFESGVASEAQFLEPPRHVL